MSIEFFGDVASNSPLPFSAAVKAGNFIFVSGQVAKGSNGELVIGGIEAQTRQAMLNVEAALKLAGCTFSDVVKINVWLDDARDFAAFNQTYATFFPKGKPARSTVQSALMIDGKIEIDAIAYKE